ncbi:MAG TPA: hypothetical protein VFK73_02190 [Paludibacter sp.]|nr:hypothetical protein [Paludibacter sp.]
MKKGFKVILFFSLMALVSCGKNEPVMNDSEKLIGSWVNPVLIDTLWKYQRATTLKDNDYGLSFKEGQVFVERKNAGWCGTPPVAYDDFAGTWTKNDSLINITVAYWGGLVSYQWKVISVDKDNLVVYKIKEDYQSK